VTRKRPFAARKVVLDEDQINYFLTGTDFCFFWEPEERERDWKAVREEILANWVRKHPGTRPWAWWRYDAPRWTRIWGAWFDGTLPEPRKRLGGIGTPNFESLNVVPSLPFGIPDSWVSPFDVEYYNGRAKNIHGNRIGEEHKEGDFPHDSIDPDDPPVFESQASYLKRHGLLLPGEEERLTDADYELESVR
jgi:hypothetical protein